MKLKIKHWDPLLDLSYDIELESYYIPPWYRKHPSNILTFDGYAPELKGWRNLSGFSVEGTIVKFELTNTGGWVTGIGTISQVFSSLLFASDWEQVLEELYPWEIGDWEHSGVAPQRHDIAIVPPHLPGGGMVVIKDSEVYEDGYYGSANKREGKKFVEDALTMLGYVRI